MSGPAGGGSSAAGASNPSTPTSPSVRVDGDFSRGWEDVALPAARRGRPVRLPAEYPTFVPFFALLGPTALARLTADPVDAIDRRRPPPEPSVA